VKSRRQTQLFASSIAYSESKTDQQLMRTPEPFNTKQKSLSRITGPSAARQEMIQD